MKSFIYTTILFLLALNLSAQSQKTFYDYEVKTINGDSISLSQYKGKRILVVNTASYCGYTPQFKQLEELYQLYKNTDFEIIGFPCNDFGKQDPYSDSTIINFCTENYKVTFPMMSKIQIVAGDTAPIYKWLQKAKLNGVSNANVDWNFNKFLIDETGHWVRHFSSPILPTDTSITNWITKPSTLGISAFFDNEKIIESMGINTNNSNLEVKMNHYIYKCALNLYSIDGQLIDTIYNGKASKSQVISHSIATLANGTYILTCHDNINQKEQSIKFAIQK